MHLVIILISLLDMLDEFSATRINGSQDPPQQAGAQPAETINEPDMSDATTDDFSKQLQEQMAALMGEGSESPEMKREIEAMMRELGAAADPGAPRDGSTLPNRETNGDGPSSSGEEPFQETIRRTMERMQASGEQATAAAAAEDEEMLAKLLKEMQKEGLDSAADEEGINKMLLGMMEELTNKDILYEPMKELHDKFPAWMAKNRSQTGADDLERYETQQKIVAEIVGRFEQKGYSDTKGEDRAYIVERMQQVRTGVDCL